MVVVEYKLENIKKNTGLTKEKIVDGLTEIGAPTTESNGVLTVELTPNRPDWFSPEGIARSLCAYYGKEFRKPDEYKTRKGNYATTVDKSVSDARPYTVNMVVKGLKLNDGAVEDLVQLQDKLMVTLGRNNKKFGMGYFDLDKIKFPIRYTTMKPQDIVYTPLNYGREANAIEILEKHPKGKEFGHLINKFERYPVFVDAGNNIMVLIPIVNSEKAGKLDSATKNVFVEVTGNDLNMIKIALNIIACMFIDKGGEVYQVEMNYSDKKFLTPDLTARKVKLDKKQISKLLGMEFSDSQLKKLLQKMSYELKAGYVYVPPYRADIIHFVDIIEDIAIAYGYNNFETTIPNFFSPGILKKDIYDDAAIVMHGMGFLETKSFILTNKKGLDSVNYEEKNYIEIMNPATEDYTLVKPTMLISMLEAIAVNKTRGLPQKMYEIGLVNYNGQTKKQLIFAIIDKKLEFADVRGYLQTLINELDLKVELKKEGYKSLVDKSSCSIYVNGKKAGYFGEISTSVKSNFKLEFPAFVCVLEF
ncbi:MAG: phenylalanine--tRNA ligase subunit beta [Candidatus Micrarchaeota archaeon]|nr:phenylalanine--tRNA ligase subunit beta [Candidatus Micrarchaeota archaeon]